MKRYLLDTLIVGLVLVGTSWLSAQQGPATLKGNGVTGVWSADQLCVSSTTKDSYISEVGANDPGVYTAGTNCVAGTLRADFSNTALTLSSGYNLVLSGTGQIQWPNGTVGSPAIVASSDPTSGRYRIGLNNYGEAVAGAAVFDWNATRLNLAANYVLNFAAGTGSIDLSAATAGTQIVMASGGVFYFNNRSKLSSSADNQFLITNSGLTTGFGINTGVDGTFACRNRAFNADCTFTAGAGTFSGVVSGNPGFQVNAAAATGTILRGNGTNYIASTNTFPDTAAAGTFLVAATANVITASAVPVLGVNASVAGTLGLANSAGGGNTITFASGATSAYTITSRASVPAQGDLETYSNGTGQVASVVDVAAGSYLRSGGVGAVPVYSTLTLPTTSAAGTIFASLTTNTVTASSAPVLGIIGTTNGTIALANGAGGGNATTLASLATSAYTLTYPASVPAQGDLMTFSNGTGQRASVVDVAAGSYLRSGGVNAVPVYSTTTLPNTVATGNILFASATNVVSAATPGSVNVLPANQTGNATATLKMNGLGAAAAPCIVTPAMSGRIQFTISGQAAQTTTADGVTWLMSYGTGAAPANAGAAAGTIITAQLTHTALTGALEVPFSLTGVATGLSLVATWFDLQVANVTGGTASITNVTCSAIEF